MNKALLDTDIFSEFLKGHDPRVQQNAAAYRQAIGPLTISVVTAMEIIKGLHKMHREPEIQTLLARLAAEEVLEFDIVAAERSGRIHADLERIGQPIGWADTVIAAICLRHGLELVTGNTAHYQRIQQIGHPLVLVNWRV
jgi:predicted nucleic acid-binding protein